MPRPGEEGRPASPLGLGVYPGQGAVSEFEKALLVRKLGVARVRKCEVAGRRVEGRKPVPSETVAEAKRLYRRSPKTGKRRSYRAIARALAERGHVVRNSGRQYGPESVKRMLART